MSKERIHVNASSINNNWHMLKRFGLEILKFGLIIETQNKIKLTISTIFNNKSLLSLKIRLGMIMKLDIGLTQKQLMMSGFLKFVIHGRLRMNIISIWPPPSLIM